MYETPKSLSAPEFDVLPKSPFRVSLSESLRYWEPRRLLYNAILAGIVILNYFALPQGTKIIDSKGASGLPGVK